MTPSPRSRRRAPRAPRLLPRLLPLAALAAGFGLAHGAAQAQAAAPASAAASAASPSVQAGEKPQTVMPVIKATGSADRQGKEGVQATTTRIGKGQQELRDIPQSITVVTEKLIDDRNLDTLKDVLKNTAGVTFLAAEGGEEDIRLRGFPLQGTGDVFVDGMRDPAFYDRDTFFYDRLELLRGSASMLFGRGSTGGAVNQVSKVARAIDEHQLDFTVGNHAYRRMVGDFNLRLGSESALRLGAMLTEADDNGAGSSINKSGVAATARFGIGTRNETSITGTYLDNRNGMNYGMPWIRPTPTSPIEDITMLPLDPASYYGMASDRNNGEAATLTATHTHRFDRDHEITAKLRRGQYKRDQRAGAIRLARAELQPGGIAASLETFGPDTVLTRGSHLKIQDLDTWFAQADYSGKFRALGLRHEVQVGMDYAREEKTVFGARNTAQGGVVPSKPTTTIGTPSDGAAIDESLRTLRTTSDYVSNGVGVYAQDLLQVAPAWKLLLGLRYDHLSGDYNTYAIPNNAPGPVTTSDYRMKVS